MAQQPPSKPAAPHRQAHDEGRYARPRATARGEHRRGRFEAVGPRHQVQGGREEPAAPALLDAYEATLDRRYFDHAEKTMQIILSKYFDLQGGGFFDRSSDAPPMGGLELRRKPFQDSPTPSANATAAILLDRLYGFTGNTLYRERAQQTLEAFAGLAPQYGIFAATYGLATLLHARHPVQVVITGAGGDPLAARLLDAAAGVYRFGKAILRITPEVAKNGLAPALQQTIPHLRADLPQAIVCVETSCHPPINDPSKLSTLLNEFSSGVTGAAGSA